MRNVVKSLVVLTLMGVPSLALASDPIPAPSLSPVASELPLPEPSASPSPMPSPTPSGLPESVVDLLCATERVVLEQQLQDLREREKIEKAQVVEQARPALARDAALLNLLFDRLDVAARYGLREVAKTYADHYAKFVAEMQKRGLSEYDQSLALSVLDGRYRRQILPTLQDVVLPLFPEQSGVAMTPDGLGSYFYADGFKFQLRVQGGKVAVIAANPIKFRMAHGSETVLRRTLEMATGIRKGVPKTSDPAQISIHVIEEALNLQDASEWGYGINEGNRLPATVEITAIESSGFLQSCRQRDPGFEISSTATKKTIRGAEAVSGVEASVVAAAK